ncbi:SRPBCC family protein [Streptomyces sp. NPDC054841]
MEHEVFVPVPAETLRQTLADPARVARCVPGLQQDADASAGPLAGRLKIRVGGHTITYRGALRITEQGGDFAVEGEGTEARGSGSAKFALTLRLIPAEGGTTLSFTGTAHADGRLAEATPVTAQQAATRLLDRFTSSLVSAGPVPDAGGGDEATDVSGTPGGDTPTRDAEPGPTGGPAEQGAGAVAGGTTDAQGDLPGSSVGDSGAEAADATDESDESAQAGGTADDAAAASADSTSGDVGGEDDGASSVSDVDVPSSALDPLADEGFGGGDEPPAEAAHARRTMIGRSAEEVDHAPPQAAAAGGTLRWVAPAAALAIASAVVVGRALRRRR